MFLQAFLTSNQMAKFFPIKRVQMWFSRAARNNTAISYNTLYITRVDYLCLAKSAVTNLPCSPILKVHAIERSIVGGSNMLRPFAWKHNNVGTYWHLLRIV